MKTETKKHGGHQTGFRQIRSSAGHGPVFEIRAALSQHETKNGREGYSQERLAKKIGLSTVGLRVCEREGRWPKSPAVQSFLLGLLDEAGIDASRWPPPDESGVFL